MYFNVNSFLSNIREIKEKPKEWLHGSIHTDNHKFICGEAKYFTVTVLVGSLQKKTAQGTGYSSLLKVALVIVTEEVHFCMLILVP